MLKAYKKKFILSNLCLVGFVLLVMNTVFFTYSCHTGMKELKTTMQQMLAPYNALKDIIKDHMQEIPQKTDQSPDLSEKPPKPMDESASDEKKPPALRAVPPKPNEKYSKSVFVFFYNTDTKTTSVISKEDIPYGDDLQEIAETVQAADENFGKITGKDLFFYKQATGNDIKIAVAEKSFLRFERLKLLSLQCLIFCITMLIFYFISRYIAGIAIKPLEDSIEREKQFITDISHDLKTPITAILANTDILGKNPSASVADMNQWISGTKQAAANMRTLIEEMLLLSKTETIKEIHTEAVNFTDITEQNALVMESVAYERDIQYRTKIQKGIYIQANSEYVKRIVASLIDNALKYEAENGSVTVELSVKNGKAQLQVTNQTSVIPKEDLPHIFERFYRSDKSRQANTGHGLGLAIVKNLTDAMNGKINAVSSEKEGTIFTVSFPIINQTIKL